MKTLLNLLPKKLVFEYVVLALIKGIDAREPKVIDFLVKNRTTFDRFFQMYRQIILMYADRTNRKN